MSEPKYVQFVEVKMKDFKLPTDFYIFVSFHAFTHIRH